MNISDALSICASTKEDKDFIAYKLSSIELCSYCKSIDFFLSEISDALEYNHISKASRLVASMRRGLDFVLEDIKETERKINTE